jgi:hypothetical protein
MIPNQQNKLAVNLHFIDHYLTNELYVTLIIGKNMPHMLV